MKAQNVILRRISRIRLGHGLWLGLLLCCPAWADSISYSYSSGHLTGSQIGFSASGSSGFQSGQTDFASGYSGSLQMFNPSLGTLTSVSLTLDAQVNTSSTFYFHDYTGQQPTPNGSLTHSLRILPQLNIAYQNFISGDANSGPSSLAVPANGSVTDNLSAQYSQSFDHFDPSTLSLLTGSGFIPFDIGGIQRHNFSSFDADGSANAPDAVFGLTVTYNFTPVPEPGTLTLVIAGLLGIAGLRLRLRRKQITS
jgi:PEP-CTERM motif